MSTIKKILRKTKRILIKSVGSKTDELYWKYRHLFDSSWGKSYISESSVSNSHRSFLIEKITKFFPETILEIGCSSGPNLYLLAKKYPHVKLYGIDISAHAISEGKKFLRKQNIQNVFLRAAKGLEALATFEDKSIDVIFTDATLIYFGTDKIAPALSQMVRVAKKAIVLLELHQSGLQSIYQDNWIHNYQQLFEKNVKKEQIKITKIPKGLWDGNWADFGHLIEVKL